MGGSCKANNDEITNKTVIKNRFFMAVFDLPVFRLL